MSITVSLYVENQVLYVNLNGELDHHTSDQLRSRLNTVMSESQIKHIVFNLKHLDFMDSSGIGMLMGRYKSIQKNSGKVAITGLQPTVKKIVQMSGLHKILLSINLVFVIGVLAAINIKVFSSISC